MPRKDHQETRPLSAFNWPLYHHLPLEGATPIEKRNQSEEYTWASQPDIGFRASYDPAEDHDGAETLYFSLLRIESGDVTWADGTTGTVERLVIEDLTSFTYHPGRWRNASGRREEITAGMFGQFAVPRLAAMGTWKQASALAAGDVVHASQGHEYEQPRTVKKAVCRPGTDGVQRVEITWDEERPRALDRVLRESAWVALATGQ